LVDLLAAECKNSILKEKVMLKVYVTRLPNAINCSCWGVVGAKSGQTSCARNGNNQNVAMTKVDLVFWWRFKLEEVCRWKLVFMFLPFAAACVLDAERETCFWKIMIMSKLRCNDVASATNPSCLGAMGTKSGQGSCARGPKPTCRLHFFTPDFLTQVLTNR
jgi:hypothetical protein